MRFLGPSRYYCVVKAVDGRGFFSTKSSNGITVEVTSPVGGTVLDGSIFGVDVDVQDDPSSISASWVRVAPSRCVVI